MSVPATDASVKPGASVGNFYGRSYPRASVLLDGNNEVRSDRKLAPPTANAPLIGETPAKALQKDKAFPTPEQKYVRRLKAYDDFECMMLWCHFVAPITKRSVGHSEAADHVCYSAAADWAKRASWKMGGAKEEKSEIQFPRPPFTPVYAFLARKQLHLKQLHPELSSTDTLVNCPHNRTSS